MSQSNPMMNPFGESPANGSSDFSNPFQIVGGGSAPQPSAPSPFEAVSSQAPYSPAESASAKIPEPRQPENPAAQPQEPNPFQIAPQNAPQQQGHGTPPQQQEAAPPHGPSNPQGTGGFEMKGFAAGPAPMNQLEKAPLGGDKGGGDQAPPPAADPFAGMDLPRGGGGGGGSAPAAEEAQPAPAPAPEPVAEFVAADPEPEPEPEPAPERVQQQAPPPKQKEKAAPAPVQKPMGSSVTSDTKQLALRAIFGVDHELSHQEIIQRARSLPGISGVAQVSADQASALNTLRDCAGNLGLKDEESIVMSCPEGFIDFLGSGGTSLAILRDGDYPPGVRETLLIVASELDML